MKNFCLILITLAIGTFYFYSKSIKTTQTEPPQVSQEEVNSPIEQEIDTLVTGDISDNTTPSNNQPKERITEYYVPELTLPLKMQKAEKPLISQNFLGTGPTLNLTDNVAIISGARFDSGPLQTNLEKESNIRYGVGINFSLTENLQVAAVYEKANHFNLIEHSYEDTFHMSPKEDFFGIYLQYSF